MSCGFGAKSGLKSTYSQGVVARQYDEKARIRVVHNVAKGPSVDIVFNGKVVLTNVPYKAISDYLKVPAGPARIEVVVANTTTLIIKADVNLATGSAYTVIAHGDAANLASLAALALTDDMTCPAPGKAHVRFIHAAAKVPAVDIYVNESVKVFPNVAYGKTGTPTYLPVDAGIVNVDVTPAGALDMVLGPLPLNLESGQIYTVIASGLLNDPQAPLTALVTEDSKGMCVSLF